MACNHNAVIAGHKLLDVLEAVLKLLQKELLQMKLGFSWNEIGFHSGLQVWVMWLSVEFHLNWNWISNYCFRWCLGVWNWISFELKLDFIWTEIGFHLNWIWVSIGVQSWNEIEFQLDVLIPATPYTEDTWRCKAKCRCPCCRSKRFPVVLVFGA